MPYQRFLIADFKTAKDISKMPWLVPQDAFPTLLNGRVRKGVLEKRYGMTLLDSTGAGLPIMGIFESRYKGIPRILVVDTKRLYSYSLVTGALTDLSGVNTFTGGDYDYFRFCTYYNKTYFDNGVNGPYAWDGHAGTVTAVSTAGAVTIQKCRGLFMLKSRLHFVAPTIGNVLYPNRIYYTDVGLVTITSDTQYYVYERDDVPVTYKPLDMDTVLIMGRRSAWRAEYTGDTSTPFRTRTVDESTACVAPHVAVEFLSPTAGRLIATLSNTQVVAFDGYQYRKIDWTIRDLTQEMAMAYLHYCQGAKLTEREAFYLTYPETGETKPNKVLEYDIHENNWTTHNWTLHCVAGVSGEVDPTSYSLNEAMIGRESAGYTLAGDAGGNLLRLDYGDDDNGSDITFQAITAALNPFHSEGRKAYFGWLELYCDNDSTASFTVKLYKDDSDTAYRTVPVSCEGAGARFWQRIGVGGEVGNFHRIEITNTDSGNRPRIHAIALWFKSGGLMSTQSGSAGDWPDQTWRLSADGGNLYLQRKESGAWVNYTTWG